MSNQTSITQRLDDLRQLMAQNAIAAWVVYTADPHLSEYLPDYWQERVWLSGFTGSAGFMVVTADKAALWTDSRYWEQASLQLENSTIELMKQGLETTPSLEVWLAQQLPKGAVVGVNAMTVSTQHVLNLKEKLAQAGIEVDTQHDLVSALWESRPALPCEPVFEHTAPYVGQTREQKIAQLRSVLQEKRVDWHLISSLDEVAWLLNLRGADVSYNPVFLAHCLLSQDQCYLFVDPRKINADLTQQLQSAGVQIKDYESLTSTMNQCVGKDQTLLIDPNRTAWGLVSDYQVQWVQDIDPVQLFKSRKTTSEVNHIKSAMERDGVALCTFFAHFEEQLAKGKRLTELDVDEQLSACRAAQDGFVSLSFATIAGFNANGALPHYRALPEAHSVIEGDGLLLIDSGGQYVDGTTDITRVIPIGQVGEPQRRDYTLVLKGMIALSKAIFPLGISSTALDALAREPLWKVGLDYGHGTGHGVGYFLNVHEGPQVISYHASGRLHTQLYPGMITSNEPGLYRPGQWGIRIENLLVTRTSGKTEFGDWLRFETLTLCPIDTRCIQADWLTAEEVAWLDNYHAEVRNRLLPLIQDDFVQSWLIKNTQPLGDKEAVIDNMY